VLSGDHPCQFDVLCIKAPEKTRQRSCGGYYVQIAFSGILNSSDRLSAKFSEDRECKIIAAFRRLKADKLVNEKSPNSWK